MVEPGTSERIALNSSIVKRRDLEHPMRRHLRVEAGDRQPLRMEPGLAQRAEHDRRDLAHHARERRRDHERLHHVVERRTREQRARSRRVTPGTTAPAAPACGGSAVVSCRSVVISAPPFTSIAAWWILASTAKLSGGRSRNVSRPSTRYSSHERPRQVQRPGVDARGLDAELPPVAGLRQRDVAHVVLEVEALVLDPVGIVDLERDAQQLLPENRRQVQAALDVLQQALEPHPATGGGRRVVDIDQRDVGIGVARFPRKRNGRLLRATGAWRPLGRLLVAAAAESSIAPACPHPCGCRILGRAMARPIPVVDLAVPVD